MSRASELHVLQGLPIGCKDTFQLTNMSIVLVTIEGEAMVHFPHGVKCRHVHLRTEPIHRYQLITVIVQQDL